jgi:hypothetical protein
LRKGHNGGRSSYTGPHSGPAEQSALKMTLRDFSFAAVFAAAIFGRLTVMAIA